MVFYLVSLGRREFASITLLSIVLPISLLATFRLTGVLREPPTPEEFTLDEVTWEIERPSKYTRIVENVENAYTDYAISINTSVFIHEYFENSLRDPYWNRDGISFSVSINAAALEGSIASLAVEFLPSDANSTIYVILTFSSHYNVVVTRVRGIGASTGVNYVEAKVSGLPCSLRLPVEWVFTDQNLENHQLRVNVKVTYSNGETYQTVVAPIVLKVRITPS